jgi:hypothetical protein
MRYFLMLAAAASLAACHQRAEDEVGAAPERGDTTAVTTADTTAVTTDTTMGAIPGDTTMVSDTTAVTADSAYAPSPTPSDTATQPADSAAAGAWDSTSVTPSDTTKQ